MHNYKKLPLFSSVICGLLTATALPAQTITVFDVPGSLYTFVSAMNQNGVITGTYTLPDLSTHAYIRDKHGAIATFDAPGDGTAPTCINDDGVVAGTFSAAGIAHGFVRQPNGAITTFAPPDPNGFMMVPAGINNAGTITGSYQYHGIHGFVRDAKGVLTPFDAPTPGETIPTSINDAGVITGMYSGADGYTHGFVRSSKGAMVSFDVAATADTTPAVINPSGEIAGFWFSSTDHQNHGFIRSSAGVITTFDPPGSFSTGHGTNYAGIGRPNAGLTPSGTMTGAYSDGIALTHGFIRDKHGAFTTFVVPGADVIQTLPMSITASGIIAGNIRTTTGAHGFIREK